MIYAKKQISVMGMSLLMLSMMGFFILMQFRWNQTLDWKTTNVVMPNFRGEDGQSKPPVYSADELLTLVSALQESVSAKYKETSPSRFAITFKPRSDFKVETRVMELFDGSIDVEVQAYHPKDDVLLKEWKKDFNNPDAFLAEVDALGAQIAGELIALRP